MQEGAERGSAGGEARTRIGSKQKGNDSAQRPCCRRGYRTIRARTARRHCREFFARDSADAVEPLRERRLSWGGNQIRPRPAAALVGNWSCSPRDAAKY